MGIQSINLLKIFIVKCPEPNTTKNPPLQHIGKERTSSRLFLDFFGCLASPPGYLAV